MDRQVPPTQDGSANNISLMKRHVSAELDVGISAPTTLEFQIAVAPHPGADVDESLSFVLDGKPIAALEISGAHGNRIHKFDAPIGNLQVAYTATIVGQTYPAPVTEYDLSMYLRPSFTSSSLNSGCPGNSKLRAWRTRRRAESAFI